MAKYTAAAAILVIMLAAGCGDSPDGPDLTVEVTSPGPGGATADQSYTVEWSGSGGSGASVTLYYDTDTTPGGGMVQIASGQSASGSYTWNLESVPSGEYYVRAVIGEGMSTASDYSDGTLTVDHGGAGPDMLVLTPPAGGATADSSYEVTWESSGFSAGATVDLYYDIDTDSSSGLTEIAADLEDDGSHTWDLTSVDEGYYYVFAVIEGDTIRAQASDYSEGTLAVDHGTLELSITITQPPAAGDEADNFYTIEWDSEAPPSAAVALYYDQDTNPDNGMTEIETGVGDDGYYTWNCAGVAEGDYYIYGVISTSSRGGSAVRRLRPGSTLDYGHRSSAGVGGTDGGKEEATDYSDGVLTIAHGSQYDITVTAPPAGGDTADASYDVMWDTDAPPGEGIDLFYASDTTGSELFTIAEEAENTGTYKWATSGVEEGIYYVLAVVGETRGVGLDWSDGPLTVVHEEEYYFDFTAPPPSGDEADETYLIQWETDAPDTTAMVDLYYSDTEGPGGTLVQIAEDTPNVGAYSWDCASVEEGEYWLWGSVDDGSGGTGSGWSEGSLIIDHSSYTMEVTAPPEYGASADSSYTVEWEATAGPSSVVDLYWDQDDQPGGIELIASGLDNTGSYVWNTVNMPEGSYYVYAAVYDPDEGRPDPDRIRPGVDGYASDYSDGPLTISHEYFFVTVTAPPSWGATTDSIYTVQWAAEAPSGSTIDLYYDTDTLPGSGLEPITEGLAYDDYQYVWDCTTVEPGSYYVYALLDDGQGSTTSDYSDGMLTIGDLYLYITTPDPGGATADTMFTIEWISDGPTGRTIDLYYDTDTLPGSGLEEIVSDLVTSGYQDSYDWRCSGVPEGEYYIYGVLDFPTKEPDSASYSPGILTIQH
jgi:hypothetical protein